MSAIGRMARRLLNLVVRHSTPQTRSWGEAMLREMDFVEREWPALSWALGSTTALCRHSISCGLRAFFDRTCCEPSLKSITKSLPAVITGIVAAGTVLTICIMALVGLLHASWFEPTNGKLADRLLGVAVPEAVYMIGAALLWRHRKSMAVGILVAGVVLITHAAVHFATHG